MTLELTNTVDQPDTTHPSYQIEQAAECPGEGCGVEGTCSLNLGNWHAKVTLTMIRTLGIAACSVVAVGLVAWRITRA